MWWKRHKGKVLAPALVLALLVGAFWYGGDAPGLRGWTVDGGDRAAPSASAPAEQPDTSLTPDSEVDGSPVPGADTPPEEPPEAPPRGGPEEPAAKPEDTPPPEEPASQAAPSPGEPTPEMVPGKPVAEPEDAPPPEEPPAPAPEQPAQGMVIDPATGKDKYRTDPVPDGKPIPVEPQETEISDTAHTCTLSVRCDTILHNLDWLDPDKRELVPEDGILFPETAVTFYEGESVFHVLQREMKQAGIHMEFTDTPMYNSAYIEGIGNLYEFDCGQLSGWMYSVNGWYPNYGCSRYQLRDGDVVEWRYTCNLGVDIGGSNALG